MKELVAIHKIKKVNLLLLALAHPVKRKIIQLLHEKDAILVGDLVDTLKLAQPVVSQHLATLRKYKIVATRRKGKHISYFLDRERLAQIEARVENFD